ncbi:mitochondrial metalloendopeptidase OMA1 [Chaetomidium leptoderma]|uniref:Mitochondrial metalloendopeptidase OMA1 n=1 Tax=Chaetomidium leptoderma TaxID=669021 RepID=A0AAN6ZZU4_9PEZI|nr:mitochondrial metalloendopeptidase OMA1 [Chaetomidium leptoderma]
MFRVLRPRSFPSQRPSCVLRLRPPPCHPTESLSPSPSPFSAAARNISLGRRLPPPTQKQRSATTPATYYYYQQRFYNYNPNPNQGSRPHDPSHRDARLRTAKPLLHWRGWRALNTPSTYTVAGLAVAAALLFYFSHLETVPVSGRTRFNVYSPASVRQAGALEHKRLLWELETKGVRVLPGWDPRTVRVKRVMRRLLPFSGMNQEEEEWEVFVVEDDGTANAFVLPGGKVFVFSGILRLARNDSGLATVLGHEIAHNLADHHGERLSQDVGASIVLYSLVILGGVFGLGPLIFHFFGSRFLDVAFGFPMSRMQESEADYIGLMMMAEACYDPQEAASFWARMERAAGQEVPEWMSTHPTNTNRIKKIQEWLPQAMDKRAQSDCSSTTAFADLFRQALRTGHGVIIG